MTVVRAASYLVLATVKVSMLVLVGMAVGLLLAPLAANAVIDHVGLSSATTAGSPCCGSDSVTTRMGSPSLPTDLSGRVGNVQQFARLIDYPGLYGAWHRIDELLQLSMAP